MNIIEQCRRAGVLRDKQAQKALLEMSSLVDKQITPAKSNFYEVFDVVYKSTDFHGKSETPVESHIVGEMLLKLCSFMFERAHDNNECKEIAEELIIIASKLYANILLNESTTETTDEVKNNG
jgi:hypothetical protein